MKNRKNILVSTQILGLFIVIGLVFGIIIISSNIKSKNSDSSKQTAKTNDSKKSSNAFISSDAKKIKAGENFELNLYINTDDNYLGVFSFDFKFNSQDFLIDTGKGDSGLAKGIDGDNFILMSNPNEINNGYYRLAGICAQNCAKGNKEHIATIYAKSIRDFELNNDSYELITKELGNEKGEKLN